MSSNSLMDPIGKLMGLRYKSHPWHGIDIGSLAPNEVTTFIEVVPTDTIKYEIDKISGYLRIDRPQKYSNVVPALYGFIPQTYCDDKDPLDILIISQIDVVPMCIVEAKVIGVMRMIDGGEADDKIIAVMAKDEIYSKWKDILDCPEPLINRLRHYFLTYKNIPGESTAIVEITETYGREEAHEVIRRSMKDYDKSFRSHMNLGM